MLDFSRVRSKEVTMDELLTGFTRADLRALTDEMIDAQVKLMEDCTDADVVFQPLDPIANDTFATDSAEVNIAWTLGHVIVHITASAEEAAATAAELARGVEYHGRSRSEIDWEIVTTIAACRQRLEESRRMRHASLEMWPDAPYLENSYEPWPSAGRFNAVSRFTLGLRHDDDHMGQIADVINQAKAARA